MPLRHVLGGWTTEDAADPDITVYLIWGFVAAMRRHGLVVVLGGREGSEERARQTEHGARRGGCCEDRLHFPGATHK